MISVQWISFLKLVNLDQSLLFIGSLSNSKIILASLFRQEHILGAIFNTQILSVLTMKKINLNCLFQVFVFLFAFQSVFAQSISPGKKKKSPQGKAKNSFASSAKSEDFVEKMEKGQVNWTDQYIEAEGNSVFDTTRFKIKNQARLMAQRGAIVDAQRNLLEIVNGVLVEGQTTVKDLVVESDEVKSKVSGLLKGAVQVGKTKFEDGVATVRLRIPLYAEGLGQAVDTTEHSAPVPSPPTNPAKVDSLPSEVFLSVSGAYKPRLFPNITDEQNNIIMNLAESFDPTKGKAPQIVRQSQEIFGAIKGKKGKELLEAAQDKLGNLVLTDKSKERVEKWKKAGLLVWGVVKKLILPI